MSAAPPGWSQDELSRFLEMARNNEHATFHNLRGEYALQARIDEMFLRVLSGWRDPENMAAAPFLYRAHAAYRAAVRLAVAGQTAECYTVARGALEYALYANHIDVKPQAWDVWRRRGEGETERRACAQEFSGRNLFPSLRGRHEATGSTAGSLYERAIDLGAHPNEEGLFALVAIEETESDTSFVTNYLSGDGPQLRHALKHVAHTGLVVLGIFSLIFPRRFAEAGVVEALQRLRNPPPADSAT